MTKKNPDWEARLDRCIAVLGGFIPISMVLGVVVYEFFIAFTGLVWLVSRVRFPVRFQDRTAQNLLFWPVLGWFVVIMVTRIVNWGTAFQFVHDFAFLRYPLFIVAMLDVSKRMPVHRYLIGGLLAGIAYAGLNVLSAHLIGYDIIGKPLSRYVGKLKEGARIGALCAYAAPMLLLWGLFDQDLDRRKRLWIIIIGFIGVLLVFSSQVRTALLSALIGLIGGFLSLLVIRKKMKSGHVLGLAIFAGLGVWGVMWMEPSLESIYDRVYFWQVSWQVWLHNPIAGVGISSFNDAYRQIAESGIVPPFVSPTGNIYQSVKPHHAHNLILQLLACNGLLGLGAFGWIYWRTIRIIRSNRNSWRIGLLSWPFVCLAIGLTGWNIYDPFYTAIITYFLTLISLYASVGPESQSA